MSEAKHTPGPWNFTGNGVYAADGTTVADNEPHYPQALDPCNGHLIAAAPELLEALEELEQLVSAHISEEADNWCKSARAAIAKAKGTL